MLSPQSNEFDILQNMGLQNTPFSRPSPRRSSSAGCRTSNSSKIDPSFKSKRYRDKLREQIKALENLLPVDKATLHRKLDSQTVFRLAISYFRIKSFLAAAGLESAKPPSDASTLELPDGSIIKEEFPGEQPVSIDGSPLPTGQLQGQLETQLSLEALDGFLLVITVDGTILYATDNMSSHLGFHHVDLVHRCIYGIVHPDDHQELRIILEETLGLSHQRQNMQGAMSGVDSSHPLRGTGPVSRDISFICRMKCFNGTNTGFVKMHCTGTMKSLPDAQRVGHAPLQVLFAAFRPFILLSADTDIESKQGTFWTTHELDLNITSVDSRSCEMIGIDASHLEGKSLYELIHPDDLLAVYVCHKTLIETEEVHTMFFRLMRLDGTWQWLHSRGRAITKNGRKSSLVFAHNPVREEDISYLRQESSTRNRYGQEDLLKMFMTSQSTDQPEQLSAGASSSTNSPSASSMDSVPRRRWMSNDTYVVASQTGPKLKDDYSVSLHSPHGACPSTFHQASDNQSQDNPGQGVFASKRKGHDEQMTEDHGYTMNAGTLPQTDLPYAMASSYYSPPQLGYGDSSLYGGFDHQPLSMYQMVAHLPPEMYDADSYRKHAMRVNAEMQQEDYLIASHVGFGSQYHLPPTPQTSPPTAYPGDTAYHMQYMPSEPMCGVTAPPSPPPSPIASGYEGTTSATISSSTPSGDCSKNSYTMDCCTGHVPSRTEYCASYIVNGAVQVKLVSGAQTGNHSYTDYDSSYLPSSSAAYTRRNLYDHCDKKPFQHYQDKTSVLSEWESSLRGSSDFTVGSSNPTYHQKTFLPCPLATTKSGCLAQKAFRFDETDLKTRAAAMLQQGALSELPPIGSFLDFLNEELNALQS